MSERRAIIDIIHDLDTAIGNSAALTAEQAAEYRRELDRLRRRIVQDIASNIRTGSDP